MRKIALVLILTLLGSAVFSQKRIITPKFHPGLRFTQNKGQWESNINYMVRMSNGNIYLENNKLTYFLFDYEKFKTFHLGGIGKFGGDATVKGHMYQMEFVGCEKKIEPIASDVLPYYENYFIGNDKSKWASNVLNYRRVVYPNVYQNIDFEFLTNDKQLKYNFYVKPGADYKTIKLKYNGARSLKIKDGKLIVETSIGTVIEEKPIAYQETTSGLMEIPCIFKLSDDVVSFEVSGPYDKNKMLIIDPTLVFAAQSGSTADNFGMTATYDAAGNFYTGGTVFALGYVTTVGAYSNVFAGPVGGTDVVITKYNAIGTAQIYSTYLGGNGSEVVSSLIVNSSNELYLYGATGSSNFPTPPTTYDNTFNGGNNLSFVFNGTAFNTGTDIYVCKFNTTGTTLLGSTYIGGSDNDGVNHVNTLVNYNAISANACPALSFAFFNLTEYRPDSLQWNYGDQYRGEIQLDKLGNVYVASSTRSSNFPAINGFDNSLGGKQDAVVFKFNPSLTNLIWSNFLGGSGNDAGYSLIVTDSMHTYVTGGTFSTDFPTVPGCYNTAYNGGKADGYIVKINPAGNAILKGTYIGTSNYDQSYFVQKDKSNNIYVYGQSEGNMPIVGPVYSNANSHQFISRLDNQLTNLNRSTVVGSGQPSIDISPSAFSVDNCGNIYISGWGGNITNTLLLNGMPTTTNALYPTVPNGYDFYLMALSANMSSLVYGTYFGGNCSGEHVDGGTSRFDPTGKVYQSVCAGCGGNDDFPVPNGKWPCGIITPCPPGPNLNTNCNNGVFKIDFNLNVAVSTISTNTIIGCSPLTVNFGSATTPTGAGSSFIWYFGTGQTNSTTTNPVFTYTNPGSYTVSLVVNDPTTCNVKDSAVIFITVLPTPNAGFTANFAACGSTVATINTTTLTPTTFTWNWGDASPTETLTSPSHTYAASGIYTISLFTQAANGCTNVATRTVSIFYFNPQATPGIICEGGVTNLTASGGTSYSWSPATGLSGTNIPNPAANPTTTTFYTVTVINTGASPPCVADVTTTLIVNPKPVSSFNYSINPCGGGVYFYDASTASITAWNWNINPVPVITSTLQDPYYFYQNGGTFTVSLISTNQFGCTDTSAQVIVVPVPPPLSINPAATICKGNEVQLLATGGVSYSWTPVGTLSATNIANPLATPTINTTYSVVITTSNNCKFLLVTNVFVNYLSTTPISVTATPTRVVQGGTTTLQYTGDPGALVTWYPGTFVTPKTGYIVTAQPDRPTTYTVIATSGVCKETLYVFVDVVLQGCDEGDAFVPNTFTPNGDGQNDVLYVRGIKVEEVYFAVYNRWGEMVFETKDKTKGWDGIYKGRPADVGVFGWYLKVKCYDGNEEFKKGNVTLIR